MRGRALGASRKDVWRHARLRGVAAWLTLFSVLLWSLVPSGFMPGVTDDGRFTIVICSPDSPDGFRTITLDADGAEVPANADLPADDHRESDHGSPCIFAVGLALAAPDDSPPLSDALPQARPLVFPGVSWALAAISLRPLGARAPPALV